MITTVEPKDYNIICDNPIPGVYGLDRLFTYDYCQELIAKAEKSKAWQRDRHDQYPTHDIPLSSVSEGLDAEYSLLLLEKILPFFAAKYHTPIEDGAALSFDSFIAKYSADDQSSLGMHHDDSLVTTLVTLNDNYKGGGTFFADQQCLLRPPRGTISIHPGQLTHFHGARPTIRGTRYVLVTFIKVV